MGVRNGLRLRSADHLSVGNTASAKFSEPDGTGLPVTCFPAYNTHIFMEVTTMAYSMDTVVGDILANPEALALMDEIIPGTSKNPMMKMAKGFTLGKIAKTPAAKIPEAKIQEFIDKANAKGL